MSKRVPKQLLAQITAMVPPDAEVVPLDFQYEDEDYNKVPYNTQLIRDEPLD